MSLVFRTPSAVTTQMEQMFPEIRSRGTSKRLQWSNGKLKSRKRDGKEKRWQGKLLAARWEEDKLNQRGCFAWLKNWDTIPTHTIAGMLELYKQLTPTKAGAYYPEPPYVLYP